MNMEWFIVLLSALILLHLIITLSYNLILNPNEPSTFTKIFPYQFIYNLLFSSHKTTTPYFSLRVDINTSQKNVKKHNEGLADLIKLADCYDIPITFSIASEYIPALSEEVKRLINQPRHEIISHSHAHSDLTQKDQSEQIKKSKQKLENSFNKKVKGLVAPQAKHDFSTLKAAKQNNIEYLSAGSLSHIRYWSFPYPFQKRNVWLIGGGIPSDHYLYKQKDKTPQQALQIWKKAVKHRANKGWFTQLEYHNFSTSKEELEALAKLFRSISDQENIEPITQGELLKNIR